MFLKETHRECLHLLHFPSFSCSSESVNVVGISSLKFQKWIVSKSYHTNTSKRNIFIHLFCKVFLLPSSFAGTGPEEQKWGGGAVHPLHLPPCPHWACPGLLQPRPAIPTSCPAKTHHRSVSVEAPASQCSSCITGAAASSAFV